MSTTLALATSSPISPLALRARFLGIMRGEWLKMARLFWTLLLLLTVLVVIGFWLGASSPDAKSNLEHAPLLFLYTSMEQNLQTFRIFSGFALLVLTSFTLGREYQYGTIRILLARGVGRLQLLLAKLAVLILLAACLLGAFTLFTALLTCFQLLALSGNLDALRALTSSFWPNIGIDLLAIFISMSATILLAAALSALTRSLPVSLGTSLIWFPADNIGTLIMNNLTRLTHSTFWNNATAYFLGPLLNRLPTWMVPASGQSGYQSFGLGPLVAVDGTHAVFVIGAYSLVFLALALIPTWKRDVKE